MSDTATPPRWMQRLSVNDVLQAGAIIGSLVFMVAQMKDTISREGELRRELETHVVDMIATTRTLQDQQTTRTEQRMLESANANRETFASVYKSLDRLSDKIETLQQSQLLIIQQQQQERHPLK